MLTFWLFLLTATLTSALVAPSSSSASVKLDNGIFNGKRDGGIERFYGIPFAKPPVDDLRLRLPQTIPVYSGQYDATKYGPACTQADIDLPIPVGLAADTTNYLVNNIYGAAVPDSEDCLTLNVVRPASLPANAKLPVLVWIFGGGYMIGSTSTYDGGLIVRRSLALNQPVIYVSMNYRLSGFGFLPGQEVKDAGVGNLGLHDQREAFRWIQKYISNFGGDSTKVTIWGESAGSVSVSLHMLFNRGNTEGLFRAAFMESGAPLPVGGLAKGQKYYDLAVNEAGCSSANDTLACLRVKPYETLKAAFNKAPGLISYQSLNFPFIPRADGVFFPDNFQKLVQQGSVAKIPYIIGNCDDEGTLFSLTTLNITTEAQLKTWIQTEFAPGTPDDAVDSILKMYPADITQGSPYDTGILNALTPQFKRIASFQGDAAFQGPRRWLLQNTVNSNPNIWSYLSKRMKALPVVGSVHASDLLNVYGGGEMGDYLIRFATNLDPNGGFLTTWPKYTLQAQKLLTFYDGLIPLGITKDNFRQLPIKSVTDATLAFPI
ncbi:carotenoid ester lipase precursor [Crepidotus variabilis]|uniref:Carboxylic ester hydrolase n=1 Tax=Crepidotus variabilis TaxID=179855 RepID=A0A9P6E6A7_9AGAR|nr:carotenoid ester lipase precursor [Crepidotus variabilis]